MSVACDDHRHWNKNDKIVTLKQIPLFFARNLENIIYHQVKFPKEFLTKIKNELIKKEIDNDVMNIIGQFLKLRMMNPIDTQYSEHHQQIISNNSKFTVPMPFCSFWFKFLKGNAHTFSRSTTYCKFCNHYRQT